MEEERDEELDRLLASETRRRIPEPDPDLVMNTLRRIRNWIVVGDLLRFATIEVLWKSKNRDREAERERKQRQEE